MADLTVELLREGDADQLLDLNRQAFGGPERDPDRPATGRERVVAAYAGDRLVASVTTHELGQFFGGRSVPMGGLAGVVVAPDQRGRGLARQLIMRSFEAMAQRGEVISTLYPTTAPLYRSMGYEIAGTYGSVDLDLDQLPNGPGATVLEPTGWDDAAGITTLLLPIAPADGAVLDRDSSGALLRRLLNDPVYQLK